MEEKIHSMTSKMLFWTTFASEVGEVDPEGFEGKLLAAAILVPPVPCQFWCQKSCQTQNLSTSSDPHAMSLNLSPSSTCLLALQSSTRGLFGKDSDDVDEGLRLPNEAAICDSEAWVHTHSESRSLKILKGCKSTWASNRPSKFEDIVLHFFCPKFGKI